MYGVILSTVLLDLLDESMSKVTTVLKFVLEDVRLVGFWVSLFFFFFFRKITNENKNALHSSPFQVLSL